MKIVRGGAVLPLRSSTLGPRELLRRARPPVDRVPAGQRSEERVLGRLHGRERRHDDLAVLLLGRHGERVLGDVAPEDRAAVREPQRRPARVRARRVPLRRDGRRRERREIPNNNAQNLASLLGKILRVDVLGASVPYGIPPSNPFAGSPSSSARPEIWAYGLRNPWRFSFDRKTGDLFIGDVGQGAWEEVDFQPAGAAGGENYGWRLTEGSHCYNPALGCRVAGITPPVAEYSHAGGNCSITGGFVYRGRGLRAAFRHLLLRGLLQRARLGAPSTAPPGGRRRSSCSRATRFTSFGEDDGGEVYAVDGSSGTLYRLVDADGALSVLTVPVVVDAGGANGARFVSELTLGNRGRDGRLRGRDVHGVDRARLDRKRHVHDDRPRRAGSSSSRTPSSGCARTASSSRSATRAGRCASRTPGSFPARRPSRPCGRSRSCPKAARASRIRRSRRTRRSRRRPRSTACARTRRSGATSGS